MKNLLVTLAVIVGGSILLIVILGSTSDPSAARLKAPPGSSIVQMFDTISSEQANVIKTFPDGTRCRRLEGPLTAPLAGPSMRFYKLECNGVTGYVNAQWVR